MNSKIKSSILHILTGSLLLELYIFAESIPSWIIGLFGCYILYLGYQKLSIPGEHQWNKGVGMLITSFYVLVFSIFIDIIPLLGFLATLGSLAAFGLKVYSIILLRKSEVSNTNILSGFSLVLLGLSFAFTASLFNLIPFFGDYISSYLLIGYFICYTLGWMKVFDGLGS
jgi:hypothetical protein